jgi:hypothetical protein
MSQDARRVDPSVVPGAKPAPSPGFIEPCRPALREESFRRTLDSRDQVRRLPGTSAPAKRTPCHLHTAGLRLDAALSDSSPKSGMPRESATTASPSRIRLSAGRVARASAIVHADLAAGRQDRLLYYAFDLLYLDGSDPRAARLAERKRICLLSCWSTHPNASSTPGGGRSRDPSARLRHGPGGHRQQTAGRALSLRPGGKLDQGQVRQT